jgi:transcriptional regulator with XRE-family HTH domain
MKAASAQASPFSSSVRDVETFNRAIGGRLKHIRTDVMRLSVADMAAAFEVGTSTIQRYEGGDRTPDTLFLARVAERAQVPLSRLLYGDETSTAIGEGTGLRQAPELRSQALERADTIVKERRAEGTLDDGELVRQVVLGVGKWEARGKGSLTPEKRAAMAALLFRYFQQSGEISSSKLDELLNDAL